MISFHNLAVGDQMEIWIPQIEQYVEVRISLKGVPEIFCTPEAAVFRRRAAVFQRRADDQGRPFGNSGKD